MPRLDVDNRIFNNEVTKLYQLTSDMSRVLAASHQKYVVEISMLRLFSLLENSISSVASKIACGAEYLDGSNPVLLNRATSFQSAVSLFKRFRRRRQKNYLIWTKGSYIIDNIKHVIDSSDNIFYVINNYGFFIDELRRIRNQVAHNNSNSRKQYREVVRRYYGAYLNNITPGILLLSARRNPSPIFNYIIQSRVFINDLTKK